MAAVRDGIHSPFDHLVDLLDPAVRGVGKICVARLVETQPEGLGGISDQLGSVTDELAKRKKKKTRKKAKEKKNLP